MTFFMFPMLPMWMYTVDFPRLLNEENDMKSIVCLFCFLGAGVSVAGIYVPNVASVGADADTEVIVTGSVEPASPLMVDITLSNPCSSNTVLLAFGKDTDADGELSTEEIKYQVGWDAGAWVEYSSNAVDSVPLESGVSNNRLSRHLAAGDWDLVNLIVRGDVSGKALASKPPTIILLY